MYTCVCVHICVCVFQCPQKLEERSDFWSWSYTQLRTAWPEFWKPSVVPLEEQQGLLTSVSSPQAQMKSFLIK